MQRNSDKILSMSVTGKIAGTSPKIHRASCERQLRPRHRRDSQVNERLMKARAVGHFSSGAWAAFVRRELRIPEGAANVTRDARCYLRDSQVARTRALCVPRCLKSFPISVVHTIAPEHCVAPLPGIRRAIAREHVYQTSSRVV